MILASLFGIRRAFGLGMALAALFAVVLPKMRVPSPDQKEISNEMGTPSPYVSIPQDSNANISQTIGNQQLTNLPPVSQLPGQPTSPAPSESSVSRVDLEQLKALEFDQKGFNWRQDWWKYLILCLGSVLVLFLLLRITKMFIRLVVMGVCILIAVIGAFIIEPFLTPLLAPHLHLENIRYLQPYHLSYALGFMAIYLVAIFIAGKMHKPIQDSLSKEKK